jgi:hypothetical protein
MPWLRNLCVLWPASPTVAPRGRGSSPMSRSCDYCEEISQKVSPSLVGIEHLLPFVADGFQRLGAPSIVVKKRHPHLRASGRQNPVRGWTFAFVGCVGFSAVVHSLYCCQKVSPSHSSVWSSKSCTGLDLRLCWVRGVFGD